MKKASEERSQKKASEERSHSKGRRRKVRAATDPLTTVEYDLNANLPIPIGNWQAAEYYRGKSPKMKPSQVNEPAREQPTDAEGYSKVNVSTQDKSNYSSEAPVKNDDTPPCEACRRRWPRSHERFMIDLANEESRYVTECLEDIVVATKTAKEVLSMSTWGNIALHQKLLSKVESAISLSESAKQSSRSATGRLCRIVQDNREEIPHEYYHSPLNSDGQPYHSLPSDDSDERGFSLS